MAENYIRALNDILDKVEHEVDRTVVTALLHFFRSDGTFPHIFVTKNNRIRSLKVGVEDALHLFTSELYRLLNSRQQPIVRTIVLNTLADWNIATDVPFDIGEGNQSASRLDGLFSFEKKDVDSLFDSLMKKTISRNGGGRACPAPGRSHERPCA